MGEGCWHTCLCAGGGGGRYLDVASAKAAVVAIGRQIAEFGIPAELGPLTVVVTGAGNVGQGALEIWKLLPHKIVRGARAAEVGASRREASQVSPFELENVVANANGRDRTHVVYIAVVRARQLGAYMRARCVSVDEREVAPRLRAQIDWQAEERHMVQPKAGSGGAPFAVKHYYEHPELCVRVHAVPRSRGRSERARCAGTNLCSTPACFHSRASS